MRRALAAWLGAALLGGCSYLQLIADYDTKTYEETIRIGKEVDLFYGKLIELPPGQRAYAPHSARYVEIEVEIRSLVRRNAARRLNEESQKITRSILGFWERYQAKHKKDDTYPDARFDRDRFSRLFNAAAAAEEAKKLSGADRDPDKAQD